MSTAELVDAGLSHHRAGRLPQAAALYRQALEGAPDDPDATHLLGVVAFQQGDAAGGAALVGKAIGLGPEKAEYHHDLGDILRAQGRGDEAAASYRRAIAIAPAFRESHVNLAVLLQQQGHLADAVGAYERALELAPDAADLHYNLGNALRDLGSTDAAIDHYRRAHDLQPRHWPSLFNLAAVLQAKGDTRAAADGYRRVIALEPKFAAAHFNLAGLNEGEGRVDEAIAGYRATIAAWPEGADAHNNLANLLQLRGRADEARASYRQAIARKPDFAEAHNNLGNLALAQGRVDEALACLCRALALKEVPVFKANFARAVAGHAFTRADLDLRPLVLRALVEPWARPADLARAAATLLRVDPALGPVIARGGGSDGDDSVPPAPTTDEMAAAAADTLFAALMTTAPVADAALERWLARARAALWDVASGDAPDESGVTTFAALLARQCLLNDYVFSATDGETAQAERARGRLGDAIAAGDDVAAFELARAACYVPLADLPHAERLLGRAWPPAVRALLDQAVAAPREESRLRPEVATLSPIEDPTSLRVRAQYEAHPYPRWTAAAPVPPASSFDAWLRAELRGAPFTPLRDDGAIDVLIAGCGTGQHAVETARRLPRARILAIDLSRASLGYAMRMAQAAGASNLAFAHGDLLALPESGRTFDVIEAVGVLHHLADPATGWRRLLAVLRPGGLLRVGVYGERAREAIVAGHAYIAQHGLAPTPADIRRFRDAAMAAPPDSPLARLATLRDFHSVSECRDMLFHVQEHRTTLPAIARLVAERGVRFVGFATTPAVAGEYARRFPKDPERTDLARWSEFEAAVPGAFPGMYEFWVQKPAAT